MNRAYFASIVGTVIEWYDFFLYAAVAGLVIKQAFFPEIDPTVGTFAALSTFAIGFVARPLGAIIFGHLGDRVGRKRILSVTLILMGAATVLTGLLPTYAEIGLLAPIALVVLRFVQGVGVGGEYGGAVLMLIEQDRNERRRGLLGALPSAAASAGFLLASATMATLTSLLSPEAFQAWGWRVPFVGSVVLLLFGYWVRRTVTESPAFAEASRGAGTVRAPLMELFGRYPRQVLISVGLPICIAVSYSMVLVYMITYASERGVDSSSLLTITTVAQAVYLPLILGWGFVSDLIGRRRPMSVGMVGTAVWAFAFWPLIDSGSPALILLAVLGSLFFIAAMYGPQAAFLSELFPVEVRYSGISFGYQVAFAVAGGSAPVLAVGLQAQWGTWVPLAVMTGAAAGVSLAALTSSMWLGTASTAAEKSDGGQSVDRA